MKTVCASKCAFATMMIVIYSLLILSGFFFWSKSITFVLSCLFSFLNPMILLVYLKCDAITTAISKGPFGLSFYHYLFITISMRIFPQFIQTLNGPKAKVSMGSNAGKYFNIKSIYIYNRDTQTQCVCTPFLPISSNNVEIW